MPKVCTMMKAHDADAKKIPLHQLIFLEEKIDGVPGPTLLSPPRSVMVSRQGKPITSAQHVQEALLKIRGKLPAEDQHYVSTTVGELKVPGMSFEESAGITRAKKQDERQVYYLFDLDCPLPYEERKFIMDRLLIIAWDLRLDCIQCPRRFGSLKVGSVHEAADLLARVHKAVVSKGMEGMMLRPANGMYFVGKRSWDMQRVVLTPTIDLRVVGFEQARSKGGAPLGMVGKIIVERHGETEGVGPGKLTHEERRAIWADPSPYLDMIAKIKYKGGETANYKSLRQATFQCWHEDKSEPDA